MKKTIFILAISLLLSVPGAQSQNLRALFSYKTFYAPGKGPYLETYLSVIGNSVNWKKNANGNYQGAIEITLTFSDATGTKYADKYNLLSPEKPDTINLNFSFLDQQRIQLPNGKYKMEMNIRDKNYPEKPYNVIQQIQLEYYDVITAVSDIELVESYTKSDNSGILNKSGFDVVPYVDNFYPVKMNTLKFYAEIYNTNKVLGAAPYLLTYFIEAQESQRVIENMRFFAKQTPQEVNILLREIPISDLPSGNYNLVVEVRNQQNEVIATKEVYFQRSNTLNLPETADFQQRDITNTFASFITNKDSLSEYIRSLRPISNQLEVTFEINQLKLADIKLMQKFFYDFWVKRSPINPEKAWMDYHVEVMRVNNDFGSRLNKGYATDRGRVYLQYGPPNTITKSYNEPSAYPYEIWHYYHIANQSNRKFVFYNPDLVSNEFTLIHSDATGEPFDNQWELTIHKRDTQTIDYDQENKGVDYFGNKANENFSNPK